MTGYLIACGVLAVVAYPVNKAARLADAAAERRRDRAEITRQAQS